MKLLFRWQGGVTPASDLFGGALRSEVRAQGVPPSATLEPCFLVHLDIHSEGVHSITDALGAFTSPETITGAASSTTAALLLLMLCDASGHLLKDNYSLPPLLTSRASQVPGIALWLLCKLMFQAASRGHHRCIIAFLAGLFSLPTQRCRRFLMDHQHCHSLLQFIKHYLLLPLLCSVWEYPGVHLAMTR